MECELHVTFVIHIDDADVWKLLKLLKLLKFQVGPDDRQGFRHCKNVNLISALLRRHSLSCSMLCSNCLSYQEMREIYSKNSWFNFANEIFLFASS